MRPRIILRLSRLPLPIHSLTWHAYAKCFSGQWKRGRARDEDAHTSDSRGLEEGLPTARPFGASAFVRAVRSNVRPFVRNSAIRRLQHRKVARIESVARVIR